jgi:hypothetical protein
MVMNIVSKLPMLAGRKFTVALGLSSESLHMSVAKNMSKGNYELAWNIMTDESKAEDVSKVEELKREFTLCEAGDLKFMTIDELKRLIMVFKAIPQQKLKKYLVIE